VLLAELIEQLVELPDLAERLGGVPVPEILAAAHLLAAAPLQVGPQGTQVVGQLGQLPAQRAVAERLVHQLLQLLALLRAQRAHQPLGRRRLPGQRVDQFLDVLRVFREELAVLLHELGERVVGVLAAGVLAEQVVEVAHHFGDALVGGRILTLQRLLEPGEALLHDLTAQAVEDLLVSRPRLVTLPVVLGELLHRLSRRAGQVVEDRLAEPGLVVVVSAQLVALGRDRLIEQLLGPGDRPVEVAPAQRLAAHPPGAGPQLVQAAALARALPDQVAQGVAQIFPGQDPLADLVDRRPHVVGRRERVRPVVPGSVAEPAGGHDQLP